MGMRTVTLLAATVTTGLSAGTFALYAHTVMPGLRSTDDRTFVAAFQALDRRIINPWFIAGTFFGALALTAAATIANRSEPSFRWILVALIAYVLVVVITVAVHVPMNDAIKAAGDPAVINVREVRARFDESRWAL